LAAWKEVVSYEVTELSRTQWEVEGSVYSGESSGGYQILEKMEIVRREILVAEIE